MTPKYIDINKIAITSESFLDSDGDALVSVNDLKRAIRQATVEDVVPVVRCKNCKFFAKDGFNEPICTNWMKGTEPNGYCNFGVEFDGREDGDTQ